MNATGCSMGSFGRLALNESLDVYSDDGGDPLLWDGQNGVDVTARDGG